MGDRLVLWSGGGRFVASKDVASAAIVQIPSSVRVQWSHSDRQDLNGSTWQLTSNENTTTTYSFNTTNWRMNNANYGQWGDSFSYSKRLNINAIRYGNNSLFLGKNIIRQTPPLNINESVYGYVGLELIDLAGNLYYWIVARTFPVTTTWTMNNLTITIGGITAVSQTISNGQSFSNIAFVVTRTVTTNTKASSSRVQAILPLISLVAAGFVIAITYADGTKTDIPVTYTPTWVQVKPANSCPPNTCFECVHDGEKCCFAKDTDGLIKVIDRFHLTS